MLVMVAQAQRSAGDLYAAASNGDKAAFVQLSARGNKGNAYAQFNLGVMYAQGNGVPKDSTQAVSWCRRLSQPKAVWPENSIYLKQREIFPGVVDNETTRCQSAWTRSVF